jgi:hypothetical protein
MKFFPILGLSVTLLLLGSCRSAQMKPAPVFDPMSLGPAGPTLKKYLDRTAQRLPRLTPMVSTVRIEASLPGMNKKGEMIATRTVALNGHISYEMKSFTGDGIIKTKVISTYLSGEQEASETTPPAITPQNYRFRFKRKEGFGERIAMIFELTPIRKMIGLFKGELWLEEETGLELRQSGRLVKNPSVIFKTADLTREFMVSNGTHYLSKVDYQAETRVVGKAILKMEFEPPHPISETTPKLDPSRF